MDFDTDTEFLSSFSIELIHRCHGHALVQPEQCLRPMTLGSTGACASNDQKALNICYNLTRDINDLILPTHFSYPTGNPKTYIPKPNPKFLPSTE